MADEGALDIFPFPRYLSQTVLPAQLQLPEKAIWPFVYLVDM